MALGSVVAGSTIVVPRLRQLPEAAVKLQAVRAKLLAQHSALAAKMKAAAQEASEDVVVLARLWQLQVRGRLVVLAYHKTVNGCHVTACQG